MQGGRAQMKTVRNVANAMDADGNIAAGFGGI
jgi:hypothetical protein